MIKCKKCGHEWEARVSNPKTCPECRCRTWSNYMKANRQIKSRDGGILDSETSGELILLMSHLTSRAKKYAYYLGKSEAAIGMTLHKLEHIGLIINKQGIKELNKEKLNEISKKLAIDLCKAQYNGEIERVNKSNIVKERGRRSDTFITLLGNSDLPSKIKNSTLTKELENKQKKELSRIRDNFAAYLQERQFKEIEKIEKMFADHNFTEFLKVYLYLFFPSIKRRLSDVVKYYIKYGDIKIEKLRGNKK